MACLELTYVSKAALELHVVLFSFESTVLVFRCEPPHPVVKLYLSMTQVLIVKKLTVFL